MEDKIKLVVMDVDGTLTDGNIYYTEHGDEIKGFCVKDGQAVVVGHYLDMKFMILTARQSIIVQRRADDLKIDYVFQGIEDKYDFLIQFMQNGGYQDSEVAYIGDDLNDLKIMYYLSNTACPCDAAKEVKEVCSYVLTTPGGRGAVREFVEKLAEDKWTAAFYKVYKMDVALGEDV